DPARSSSHILTPKPTGSGYETFDSYLSRVDDWIFSRGGATVGVANVDLTLTGGQNGIVIKSICARIIKRSPIMNGSLFYVSPQGGRPVSTILNLDSAEPCARYFNDNYLTLSSGQSTVIDLSVLAHSDTVTWSLYLNAVVNGIQQMIPVDSGQILRTTGLLPELTQYGIFYEFTDTGNYSGIFRPTIPEASEQKALEQQFG
ncbi:MAG: hypothetical protein ACRDHZ_03775, partial [Ktedonobacteraceae bacterium]